MAILDNTIYGYCVKVVGPNLSSTNVPITEAKVVFHIDGNDYVRYTDDDGCATFLKAKLKQDLPNNNIPVIDDEISSIATCDITAYGYESETVTDLIYGPIPNNKVNYPEVDLTKKSGYFYKVVVRDRTTLNVIKGATVRYTGENTGSEFGTVPEDDFGKHTLNRDENKLLHFKAEKNGYESSEFISTYGTQDLSQTTYIDLEPATLANYYYTIAVKDASGQGIEGAKVRVYSDFAMEDPYSMDLIPTSEADDEIFYTLCDVLTSVLELDNPKIDVDDELFSKYGINTSDAQSIIGSIDDIFNMTTSESDFFTFSTVWDYVQYIKESTPYPYLEKTVYTTDENGLISERTFASRPKSIYVKGVYLPVDPETGSSKYTWGDTKSGKVDATLSSSDPGFTFIVTSYSVQTYYYNFKVIDKQTQQPISGATVIYKYDDDVLDTKTSSNQGLVQFYCKMDMVYVTISKNGYLSYDNLGFSGSTTSTDVFSTELSQEHTILVIDHLSNPVAGITVSIFQYDDNGRKIYVGPGSGKHVTYATGYIDNLGNDIYNASISTPIYAGVLGYDKENEVVGKLIKRLIGMTRTLIFTLPEHSEQEETIPNDFEAFNEMSVNGIKSSINEKTNVDYYPEYVEEGKNQKTFEIRIVDPDSINTYDILSCSPVMVSNNNKSVVGSVNLNMKKDVNELRIKILNRYSGYYNPIFKDILFYKNFSTEDITYNPVKCPFSNTEFDYNYEDNYGKFGVIDNMWFHKVNDTGNKIIKTLNPYYPLIGQYAIDKRSYNVFESNWDRKHYTRQNNIDTSEPCLNMVSMKDGKCMFGSKYLNVPEMIEICGVSMGDEFNAALLENINGNDMSWKNELNWSGEWNDDWITNPDACPGEMMFKEVNDNSVDFYFFFKKRILRYFREMLREEFSENISDQYSFGRPGIDDDIDEYINKNVLKLYKLDKVRVFVRRTKKGQHNSRIENDYTSYLQYVLDPRDGVVELSKDTLGYFKSHGFVEVNNVTLTKMNTDTFDRKLVYNLRNGTKEEFGFSFILKKI